jgi:hypothetical protein
VEINQAERAENIFSWFTQNEKGASANQFIIPFSSSELFSQVDF